MTDPENNPIENEFETIRDKLQSEIAPVPWTDLQVVFARGIALHVSEELDLLDVAVAIAENETESVQSWMDEQKISAITDEEACHWLKANVSLMTAIVKPWVLVQLQDN